MLIKGFEQKSEVDKALEGALGKAREEGSAGLETPVTKTTLGFYHKGYFIQALCPDFKWKAFAKDKFRPEITLESDWRLTDKEAIQEVMKYVDIMTKRLV